MNVAPALLGPTVFGLDPLYIGGVGLAEVLITLLKVGVASLLFC